MRKWRVIAGAMLLLNGLVFVSCAEQKKEPQQLHVPADMSKSASSFSERNTDPEVVHSPKDSVSQTDCFWEEKAYSFGALDEGDVESHTFVVRNTGLHDLYIYEVNSSCGCTVPVYTKKPIKPGKEGKVEVEFNSQGKQGAFTKQLTVVTNAKQSTTTLTISGYINK